MHAGNTKDCLSVHHLIAHWNEIDGSFEGRNTIKMHSFASLVLLESGSINKEP